MAVPLSVESDRARSRLGERNKAKRQRVHAVAQAGGFGPIVKDMAKMRVAEYASYFVAAHSKAQIYFC